MIPQIILPSILTYDLKNKRFLHDRTLTYYLRKLCSEYHLSPAYEPLLKSYMDDLHVDISTKGLLSTDFLSIPVDSCGIYLEKFAVMLSKNCNSCIPDLESKYVIKKIYFGNYSHKKKRLYLDALYVNDLTNRHLRFISLDMSGSTIYYPKRLEKEATPLTFDEQLLLTWLKNFGSFSTPRHSP